MGESPSQTLLKRTSRTRVALLRLLLFATLFAYWGAGLYHSYRAEMKWRREIATKAERGTAWKDVDRYFNSYGFVMSRPDRGRDATVFIKIPSGIPFLRKDLWVRIKFDETGRVQSGEIRRIYTGW
jgi:hypothetical protein